MTRCNVVVLVIDTLRLDYCSQLDRLSNLGFVRYDNAVSPSSWTLPAHVSLITGEPPSRHKVHESAQLHSPLQFLRASREALRTAPNLLTFLRDCGYSTYGFSANPMISPDFGFEFGEYHGFDYMGEISRSRSLLGLRESNSLEGARILLSERALGTLAVLAYNRCLEGIWKTLGTQQKEKGSRSILRRIGEVAPTAPFFFFVNLMEAHEPYKWGESPEQILVSSVLGLPSNAEYWGRVYGDHAKLAISRAIEVVSLLTAYDPLIILTSDHGQLIGEGGRCGHGYFLDDALVRVPFYIRFPKGTKKLSPSGLFVSTSEVPRIIEALIDGRETEIGSENAFSESFGCQNSIGPSLVKNREDVLQKIYSRRTKCFSKFGSFVFNHDAGLVEETLGKFPAGEVSRLVELMPRPEAKVSERSLQPLSSEEERLITRRLKDLGYE